MAPVHNEEIMIPNSTQTPNIIIDEWMPRLGDVELRVLLIVMRQTLGWIEDEVTGRRKERDWISRGQLMAKAGRGHTAVSAAIKSLVERHQIIEALTEDGTQLDSAMKRGIHGNRIYYRLCLKKPAASLFDAPRQPVRKVDRVGITSAKEGGVSGKWPARKVDTTKETDLTKKNTMQPKTPAAPDDNKYEKKEGDISKPVSPHRAFMDFWFLEVQRARGIKPIITGQDGRNLKRILDAGIAPMTLEQIAIFYLHSYSFKKFSPSISTLLSAGIINGLINRTRNDPTFWKELDGYLTKRVPNQQVMGFPVFVQNTEQSKRDFSADLAKLKARFFGRMAAVSSE